MARKKRKKYLSRFGHIAAKQMMDRDISLRELTEKVEAKTDHFVTEHYIYNYLCGCPTPWKIRQAVSEVLGLQDY